MRRRIRDLRIVALGPTFVTLIATVFGLTSIRYAFDGDFDKSVTFVLLAAALDGIDGRLARLLRRATRFGGELDSLADVINFGAAPCVILYLWGLNTLGDFGWLVSLIYACAVMLRLARFNTRLGHNDSDGTSAFFEGIPSPAAAFLVFAPLYADFSGLFHATKTTHFIIIVAYILALSALMLSTLPVFSAKVRPKVPRAYVALILLSVAFTLWAVVSYAWLCALIACLGFFAAMPLAFHKAKRVKPMQNQSE